MKNAQTFALLFALSIIVSTTVVAQEEPLEGDRPDLTESARTVGHLVLQIETGFGWERLDEDGIEETLLFNPTLFRFGLGDSFELRMETDSFSRLTVENGFGEVESSGFSPVAFGIKYNFFEGDSVGDLTLGMLMSVEVPSGTDLFESEHTAAAFKLLGAWDLSDRIGLGWNLGLETQPDEVGESFYSMVGTAALGIGITERLGGFIELAVDSAEERDGDAIWLGDAGLTWSINPDLQLDTAIGSGLSGNGAPDLFFTAGLIARF